MDINVSSAVDSPSSDCVRSFERYCRVTLPVGFIEFLQYGNGGVPENGVLKNRSGDRFIERFLPLMEEPGADLLNGQYDMAVVETQIGERLTDNPDQVGCKLVPFAALFAGDFLCFDYRHDASSPAVVVWLHARSDEFSPYTEFVATSLNDLAQMLA